MKEYTGLEQLPKIRKLFFYLIVIGIVIRCFYWLEHEASAFFAVPLLDENYYDLFARTLANGGSLAMFGGFRPMLYPFFLSIIYRLNPSGGIETALFVQHLLGVGTAVVIALLSARLFRDYLAGFFSGLLYLAAAPPLFFEGELLITAFYVFLVSVTLYAHCAASERPGPRPALIWFICGALTALTAEARANMLIFSGIYPFFSAYLFVKNRRASSLTPMAAFAGALTVLALFGALNAAQTGKFQMIPSAGGVNFYLGNKPGADGMIPRQDRHTAYRGVYQDSVEIFAREEYNAAMKTEGKKPGSDPGAISRYWTERTIKTILADPVRWLKLMARKVWLVVWDYEITNNKSVYFFEDEETPVLRLTPVRWFMLAALAPLGVIMAVRAGNKNALFIIAGFLALYAVNLVMFFVNSRYRMAMWPAMTVLAGGGIRLIWQTYRAGNARRFFGYAFSACAIAAISAVNWPGIRTENYARDFYLRSLADYSKGDYKTALSDIRKGLALDPEDMEAGIHYGSVLFALRSFDEAKAVFSEMLLKYPREPRIWNNLGAVYEYLGDVDAAREAYINALALYPVDRLALQNLILIEVRTGRIADAVSRIDVFRRHYGDDAVVTAAESAVRAALGDTAGAEALRNKAYSMDKNAAQWTFAYFALKT